MFIYNKAGDTLEKKKTKRKITEQESQIYGKKKNRGETGKVTGIEVFFLQNRKISWTRKKERQLEEKRDRSWSLVPL